MCNFPGPRRIPVTKIGKYARRNETARDVTSVIEWMIEIATVIAGTGKGNGSAIGTENGNATEIAIGGIEITSGNVTGIMIAIGTTIGGDDEAVSVLAFKSFF